MSSKKSNSIVWFRNNLRVEDNRALSDAIENSDKVIGYVNIDPKNFENTQYGFKKTEKFRSKFLLESITDLKQNLKSLNITLIIDFCDINKSFISFINKYDVDSVYMQREWTRDELIEEDSLPKDIKKFKYFDQFLYSPKDVKNIYENIPRGFSNFRKKCEKYLEVEHPISIPKPMNHDNLLNTDYSIPTLNDFGFKDFEIHENSVFKFHGGESTGKFRIDEYFFKSKNVSRYKHTRNGLLGKDYSSKFSSWLANGSLSARYIFNKLKEYENKIEKNESTYWLFFELLWRDFFKYVSMQHRNKFFSKDGIYGNGKVWSTENSKIQSWINGETKESFVNANMKELAFSGFMSNRGRQNVANYLTKQLKVDWRIGAKYFEALLIDYDVHSNYGNWLYNAGIGNDSMPFRMFNPSLQSERYDPDKVYEKTWLND